MSDQNKALIRGVNYETEEKPDTTTGEGAWKLSHAPIEEHVHLDHSASTEAGDVKLNFPAPTEEKYVQLNFPAPITEAEAGLNIPAEVGGKIIGNQIPDNHEKVPVLPYYNPMSEIGIGTLINQQTNMLKEVYRHMAEQAGRIEAGVQSLKATERKLVTGHKAVEDPNGQIWIQRHYDDGSTKAEPLVFNIFGPLAVYKMKKTGKQSPDMYAIHFTRSGLWITGSLKKLSAESIYKGFVEAGICFNSKFSPSQIGRALYELLAYRIRHTKDVIVLEDMGGWYRGKYFHSENFPFQDCQQIEELPVLQKKICQDPLNEASIRDYIAEVQSIINPQDRAILILYPYISILASLLEKAGKKNDVAINVVLYEKIPLGRLGSWLLITEKPQLLPVNADVNKSTLKKICSSVQDEVLFMDFRLNALEANHSKIEKNHARVIESFLGNYSLNECIRAMGLVTISNTLYPGRNVCNVLLGRDSVRDINTNPNSARCVYGSFIHFVEENFNKVEEIIAKRRDAYFSGSIVFDIVLEIVTMFWSSKGYSFWNILGSKIGRNDFAKILQGRIFDPEDLISAFAKAVRSEAKYFCFSPKSDHISNSQAIRYDGEWIWMSLEVLENICKAQGLDDYRKELLYDLKKAGILKTDVDGYTRKLQIGGQRREFYQLKRTIFEKLGQASLVSLGKCLEDKKYV